MKNIFTCLLLLGAVNSYSQADTFVVHFALKETTISPANGAYIDQLIRKKKIAPGQQLSLLGYADYRGTPAHNDTVSEERALSVQAYLVGKGFNKNDITECAGKGQIQRPGMTGRLGYRPDRKVLIVTGRTTKMDIKNLQVNETVTLKNIFFEGGLPDIEESSMPELHNLLNFMVANPTVKIQIEGHVCCKGIATLNDGPYSDDQQLSMLRAKAVYDYLAAKGIDKSRMKYVGLGTSKPLVYPARTDEEQQSNRRVEIRILSK